MSKAIYDDAGVARPAFPGDPDVYRRRQYRADRFTGAWAVDENHPEGDESQG